MLLLLRLGPARLKRSQRAVVLVLARHQMFAELFSDFEQVFFHQTRLKSGFENFGVFFSTYRIKQFSRSFFNCFVDCGKVVNDEKCFDVRNQSNQILTGTNNIGGTNFLKFVISKSLKIFKP